MSRLAPFVRAASAEGPRSPGRAPVTTRAEAARVRGQRPGAAPTARRVVVAEPCPRSRAAIEHALLREGYRVADPSEASGAPVLLFAGAADGLHVLEARDVTGAVTGLAGVPGVMRGRRSPALGIHAFVPRPFGVADVLRVARAVDVFDRRRRAPKR